MTVDRKYYSGSMIAAFIGLADSIYLTWVKVANQRALCGSYGGCDVVNSSPYATIGGIPVALLGAVAYLTILVLLYLEAKGGFWKNNSPLAVFGISLAGVLYSAYLTYLEVAVIHAICLYCVVSAIAITVVFILSIFRLAHDQVETNPI